MARRVRLAPLTEPANGHEARALVRRYAVTDVERVIGFLRQSPTLVSLLAEATEAVGEHFPDMPLALEVVADPDVSDAEHLALSVGTSLPVPEAFDRLQHFDEDWWLDRLPRAEGKLVITLTFA